MCAGSFSPSNETNLSEVHLDPCNLYQLHSRVSSSDTALFKSQRESERKRERELRERSSALERTDTPVRVETKRFGTRYADKKIIREEKGETSANER